MWSGPNERRLINDLLEKYNNLERPVYNESEPLDLAFGLTLQQIIDVVSCVAFFSNLDYLGSNVRVRRDQRPIIIELKVASWR